MTLTNGHTPKRDEGDEDSWIPARDIERLEDIQRYEPEDPAVNGYGIKSLPKGTKPTRLVGEGAANAVFEFSVPDGHPSENLFQRKTFLYHIHFITNIPRHTTKALTLYPHPAS